MNYESYSICCNVPGYLLDAFWMNVFNTLNKVKFKHTKIMPFSALGMGHDFTDARQEEEEGANIMLNTNCETLIKLLAFFQFFVQQIRNKFFNIYSV